MENNKMYLETLIGSQDFEITNNSGETLSLQDGEYTLKEYGEVVSTFDVDDVVMGICDVMGMSPHDERVERLILEIFLER